MNQHVWLITLVVAAVCGFKEQALKVVMFSFVPNMMFTINVSSCFVMKQHKFKWFFLGSVTEHNKLMCMLDTIR